MQDERDAFAPVRTGTAPQGADSPSPAPRRISGRDMMREGLKEGARLQGAVTGHWLVSFFSYPVRDMWSSARGFVDGLNINNTDRSERERERERHLRRHRYHSRADLDQLDEQTPMQLVIGGVSKLVWYSLVLIPTAALTLAAPLVWMPVVAGLGTGVALGGRALGALVADDLLEDGYFTEVNLKRFTGLFPTEGLKNARAAMAPYRADWRGYMREKLTAQNNSPA